MSQPYTPGVWAKEYEKLTPALQDAINRETDRIFVKRTGFKSKLDPERDKDLVRTWLHIRDEVMSGKAKARTRVFLRIAGIPGFSTDPRHRGWFDAELVTGPVIKPVGGNPTTSTSGGGSAGRPVLGTVVLALRADSPGTAWIAPGTTHEFALVQFSSPEMVMTWNMERVMARRMTASRGKLQVELVYGRLKIEYD